MAPFKAFAPESLNNSGHRASLSTESEDEDGEDVLSLLNEVCAANKAVDDSFSSFEEATDCLNTSTQSSSNSQLEEELEQAFQAQTA